MVPQSFEVRGAVLVWWRYGLRRDETTLGSRRLPRNDGLDRRLVGTGYEPICERGFWKKCEQQVRDATDVATKGVELMSSQDVAMLGAVRRAMAE